MTTDGAINHARDGGAFVHDSHSAIQPVVRSSFTAGYGYDDRQGGTLDRALAPDGLPFREGLTGRRADAGMMLRLPQSDSGHVAVRLALSTNGRERRFGLARSSEIVSQPDSRAARIVKSEHGALVFGAAVQADAYHNKINSTFDHDWVTPGLFTTVDRDIGSFTVSASVRGTIIPKHDSS